MTDESFHARRANPSRPAPISAPDCGAGLHGQRQGRPSIRTARTAGRCSSLPKRRQAPARPAPSPPRQITPPSSKGTFLDAPPPGACSPRVPRTPSGVAPSARAANPTGRQPQGPAGTGRRHGPPQSSRRSDGGDEGSHPGDGQVTVLVQFLGKGGMGEVWKAWEREDRPLRGHQVPDPRRATTTGLRFQREAEVAASVQHPHHSRRSTSSTNTRGSSISRCSTSTARSLANRQADAGRDAGDHARRSARAVHFAHQKGQSSTAT